MCSNINFNPQNDKIFCVQTPTLITRTKTIFLCLSTIIRMNEISCVQCSNTKLIKRNETRLGGGGVVKKGGESINCHPLFPLQIFIEKESILIPKSINWINAPPPPFPSPWSKLFVSFIFKAQVYWICFMRNWRRN